MTEPNRTILIPIHPGPGSKVNDRMLGLIKDSINLAQWLDAELRVLIAPLPDFSEALRIEERMSSEIPREFRFHVETDAGDLGAATLAVSRKRPPEMVILAVDPTHLRRQSELLHWQKSILEHVEQPVLIIPSTMELNPFKSILVPVSGEQVQQHPRMSSALELGLRLGNQVHIPVDILHVSPRAGIEGGEDFSLVGRLSDEFHHEYPKLVDEFIAEASPFSSVRERSILRDFLHVRGETAREIFRSLRARERGLVIVEWKGSFAQGHAETVKSIFRASRYPVLLIKPAPEMTSTLKLGDKTVAA